MLPFEVTLREPTQSALKAVIEASKKTGDFQSLSLVDIKMIALTYDLHVQYVSEKETVGTTEDDDEKIIEDLKSKVAEVVISEEKEKTNEKADNKDSAVENQVEETESEEVVNSNSLIVQIPNSGY